MSVLPSSVASRNFFFQFSRKLCMLVNRGSNADLYPMIIDSIWWSFSGKFWCDFLRESEKTAKSMPLSFFVLKTYMTSRDFILLIFMWKDAVFYELSCGTKRVLGGYCLGTLSGQKHRNFSKKRYFFGYNVPYKWLFKHNL